ncbi:MAG: cell division protein FtsZ [Gammaproteobacteria bacterium]|nr:cell division protein FtsZ [Gammaproteobacteria bacterium]MCP5137230.1 cell division protein FtsZ [Gammaproteobacteria bacterium]
MNNWQMVNDDDGDEAVIKVIGVGGGGNNAVRHMLDQEMEGVEFICANTDVQVLPEDLSNVVCLRLGNGLTKGLGAGANPEVGKNAAMEDREEIAELIKGTDMLFITAGMGGGTGTGAAPVVAQIARDLGILTVAVVTKPFPFEGKKRMAIAEKGIAELAGCVDSLITIPNVKLLTEFGKDTSLVNVFKEANNVLHGAVSGISELITRQGLINVDFADVKTVMSVMGVAMMGTGSASGENRAAEAAEKAIKSPLLEDIDLRGAKGILVNVTAGFDLTIGEFEQVGSTIEEFASPDATVVIGTVIEPSLQDELRVTLVATGLHMHKAEQKADAPPLHAVPNTPRQPRNANGQVDYGKLDDPTVMRRQRAVGDGINSDDPNYFDIPSFLRRQND